MADDAFKTVKFKSKNNFSVLKIDDSMEFDEDVQSTVQNTGQYSNLSQNQIKNINKNKRKNSDTLSSTENKKIAASSNSNSNKSLDLNAIQSQIQSQNNNKNTVKPIFSSEPQALRFDDDNHGPFGIWARKTEYGKEINVYEVGSIIYKEFNNATVSRKSKFNVEIVFDYRKDANRLLSKAGLLKDKFGLDLYVPGHRQSRKGLIKYIPLYISEDQIKESCTASTTFHIINVKRISVKNRNSTNDQDQYIPTDKVIITFAGQDFPKNFRVCLVNTEIFPYVNRPMQCFNCFKFGHTATKCKTPKKCPKCNHDNHGDNPCAENSLCCTNCLEAHSSIDRQNCEAYKTQVKINTVMAFDNLSYLEAKKLVIHTKENNNILLTKDNFPPNRNIQKKYQNKEKSAKLQAGQTKSYASATSSSSSSSSSSPNSSSNNFSNSSLIINNNKDNKDNMDNNDKDNIPSHTSNKEKLDTSNELSKQDSDQQINHSLGLNLLADTAINGQRSSLQTTSTF